MMRNEMIAGLLGAALLVGPVAAHAQMPQGKMMDGRVFVSVRFVAEQMKAAISLESLHPDGDRNERRQNIRSAGRAVRSHVQ